MGEVKKELNFHVVEQGSVLDLVNDEIPELHALFKGKLVNETYNLYSEMVFL